MALSVADVADKTVLTADTLWERRDAEAEGAIDHAFTELLQAITGVPFHDKSQDEINALYLLHRREVMMATDNALERNREKLAHYAVMKERVVIE